MSNIKNIKFRRASKPFDPEVAADLIYETDPSVFKCLLDNDRDLARRVTSTCWKTTDGFWTHRDAFTASKDGQLLGIEISYPSSEESSRGAEGFVHIAKILSEQQTETYFKRMPLVELLLPQPDDKAWYIGTLSVHPSAQGLGVGRRLLENAFQRALDKGFSLAQLDVYATNPAVDFYRAMGMEVLVKSHVPKLEQQYGVPAHYRMTIDL